MSRKKRNPATNATDPVQPDAVPTEVVPVPEPAVELAPVAEVTPVVPDPVSAIAVATEGPAPARRRRSSIALRFGVAFLIGLLAAMALGVGALYAYDQQYVGRVLPGVSVGGVDLSGMTESEASAALATAYASLAQGTVTVTGPDGDVTLTYAELGRGPDVAAMTAAALGAGRNGNPAERAISNARVALKGLTIEPRVTLDQAAVARRLETLASSLERAPTEASVTADDKYVYTVVPGTVGRTADPTSPIAEINEALAALDAPDTLTVDLPVTAVQPAVTTDEATVAKETAERVAGRIDLTVGKDVFAIPTSRLRAWVTFAPTDDGGYRPIIDTAPLTKLLETMAPRIDKPAVNASFTTNGGRITGVTKSARGHTLDVPGTIARIQTMLDTRYDGPTGKVLHPALTKVDPALTTAEAEAVQPKMKKISEWTTYFPITVKNGYGANIWIPALTIDGYVVGPREEFSFWKAVGPVTREKGYKQGGAIINGRTEPQGALAGGICSCSTTLFNAALRAGYEMGARRNHYYYIDRYPLGLDATVFISGSGSVQDMTWTNDTDYPVLIRGYKIQQGSSGYVKFVLYSVPTGRKVIIGSPTVKNIRHATDTVQYTTGLPAGSSQRVEYPVDGKQVWRTITVKDRNGKVIRSKTYYSNYSRITGITLIGRAAE
jgi:vancomycin resistance protein YoaR